MYINSVWEPVDLPNREKPIGCKWVYKSKIWVDRKVETLKVRLVAKGYTQRKGINCEETFLSVVMLKFIKVLLSIVAHFDNEV
jgi:hypothetical protein